MLKTYLYIPDHLEEKINKVVKAQKTSKANVLRMALEAGIGLASNKITASTEALFELERIGKKYNPRGPKDLSKNIDKYLWGIKS